jgi:hypothetical protein
MTQPSPDSLTVIPAEHRWLRGLAAALGRAGLAVDEAVLADRILRIGLAPPSGPPVLAEIRPLGGQPDCWLRTRHFGVGYQGGEQLGQAQRQALEVLVVHLARFEAHMPKHLRGYAAIVRRQPSAAETLTRLFPFLTIERSAVPSELPWAERGPIDEVLVRTTARCNQACPFCSAPQHDEPSGELLQACFATIAELLPGAMVSLTGGEPSLRPDFLTELKALLALERIDRVQVQTNALRFATSLDPTELGPDERLGFFVSLHAMDAALYDRCTGTSGLLPIALAGIRRILAAGHRLILNTVVTSENLAHLPDLVAALGNSFAGPARPALHFSVLICPEFNPTATDYLVSYGRVAEALERATALGSELGLDVHSPLASTHAALPACLVPAAVRGQGRHQYQHGEHETGFEDYSRPWVKSEACRACNENHFCLGVPRPYAQAFGLGELEPLGDP